MSYRINRTDGEILIDLIDGIIDTTSTDLTLIGRNYKGFGEPINENFVKLLENFASTTQPSNPMIGQLWYDKQDQRLKVYNGVVFRSATGTIVNSSQPSNLVAGDLWVDNKKNKLYIYDGTDLTLVGPNYDATQLKTGFEAATQLDSTDIARTILKLFISGVLVGIYSSQSFYIPGEYAIPGVPIDPTDTNVPQRQRIYQGFTIVNSLNETGTTGFWYQGTALNAKNLVDDAGIARKAENFLPTNANGETTGSIKIKNGAGLSVGIGDTDYATFNISGTRTVLRTLRGDADFILQTRRGSSTTNAIYIDASEENIGILTTTPTATLDVNGDAKVRGTLTVLGEALFVSSTTLRVADKNIELGILEDSSEGTDSQVDGGGFILRSQNGSKDFLWDNGTFAWTSNQHINLIKPEYFKEPVSFKINGNTVLSETSVGLGVTTALGIQRLGTLTELQVDYLSFNGSTISSTTTGLAISGNGDIQIDNNKITQVADPTDAQDVTTKNYVDTEIAKVDVIFSYDVTGIINDGTPGDNSSITNVRTVLETITPASSVTIGTVGKVIGFSYATTNVTGIQLSVTNADVNDPSYNANATLSVAYKDVRNAADNGSETVVQDIAAINTLTGSASLSANKYLYVFTSNGSTWDLDYWNPINVP